MAKTGVTLWCHLLIRQDVLKKITKLDNDNHFQLRIGNGCIPNLVRVVSTSRTSSVILDVYLKKCHILNIYIKTTVIYIYIK